MLLIFIVILFIGLYECGTLRSSNGNAVRDSHGGNVRTGGNRNSNSGSGKGNSNSGSGKGNSGNSGNSNSGNSNSGKGNSHKDESNTQKIYPSNTARDIINCAKKRSIFWKNCR